MDGSSSPEVTGSRDRQKPNHVSSSAGLAEGRDFDYNDTDYKLWMADVLGIDGVTPEERIAEVGRRIAADRNYAKENFTPDKLRQAREELLAADNKALEERMTDPDYRRSLGGQEDFIKYLAKQSGPQQGVNKKMLTDISRITGRDIIDVAASVIAIITQAVKRP